MTRRRPRTAPVIRLVVPSFPGVPVEAWSDLPPAAYPPAVAEVIRLVLDGRASGEIAQVNGYRCDTCNGLITTVDRHPGVSPAYADHRAFDQATLCPGLTRSLDYPRDLDQQPTAEWYRPAEPELLGLAGPWVDHVLRGGLLVRPVTVPA